MGISRRKETETPDSPTAKERNLVSRIRSLSILYWGAEGRGTMKHEGHNGRKKEGGITHAYRVYVNKRKGKKMTLEWSGA